jgi:hypothetical protein
MLKLTPLKYSYGSIIKIKSYTTVCNKLKFFRIISQYSFCTKDEKFWEEYTKRKAQGGKYPALESQEIIYNKVIHSWKYSDQHSLTSEEFLICLRELKSETICPFLIVDVREESEYDLYKLPIRTKVRIMTKISRTIRLFRLFIDR